MRPFQLLLFIFISFQSLGQKKFETRIGLSYIISVYDAHTLGFSHYLENPNSKNGPGLKISEEYYFTPFLSITAGLNLVNTNISFDDGYMALGTTNEKYRHHLRLLELDIPVGLKFSPLTDNSLRWFIQGGVEFRTTPYGSVSVNNLMGSKINSGRADIRMFDSPIAPFFCIGLDHRKSEKTVGYFIEVNYQYLIGSYFYGGSKDKTWESDALIDNDHLISISGGIKF